MIEDSLQRYESYHDSPNGEGGAEASQAADSEAHEGHDGVLQGSSQRHSPREFQQVCQILTGPTKPAVRSMHKIQRVLLCQRHLVDVHLYSMQLAWLSLKVPSMGDRPGEKLHMPMLDRQSLTEHLYMNMAHNCTCTSVQERASRKDN